ncbi:hypothetical protein LC040_09060 [Bacillus tianshenii]|nr:hypothetical protein LC040_09060 [Bacillus tianshenii]
MGRQKKGNPNAQRNNNAKKMEMKKDGVSASYAEMELEKMQNKQSE